MITLVGSIATTMTPPSFASLSNPEKIPPQPDLSGLALWYNLTTTDIGTGRFADASFLLDTFHFVNIPTASSQTALAANLDLSVINSTIPVAMKHFAQAETLLQQKEVLDASALISAGCHYATSASRSLADFQEVQTQRLRSFSVPTALYARGGTLTASLVQKAVARCDTLSSHPTDFVLSISSPQRSVETGGEIMLLGNLTKNGEGVGGQQVYLYINGTYFGSLSTGETGAFGGSLTMPFVYSPVAIVQGVAAASPIAGLNGTRSNLLVLRILFTETSITLGDPPEFLPTQSFHVSGKLTTVSGTPLPDAPVRVTFLNESLTETTNSMGGFGAEFTVPANANDGTYYVYARFAPRGTYGPSFNLTSIQVVHVPLVLTLSAPFSYAGFQTTVSGTAVANGAAVAGASVTVGTPWGTYDTVTDNAGRFRVNLAISTLDFTSTAQVRALARPAEPYIATASTLAEMGLFNILLVILPVVAIGLVAFEADKLGVFEGLRDRRRRSAPEVLEVPWEGEAAALRPTDSVPEPIALYERALLLAATRLGLRFRQSQTIREALKSVKDAGPPAGLDEFSRVLIVAEDFLYAPMFAASRLEGARRDLAALEGVWR